MLDSCISEVKLVADISLFSTEIIVNLLKVIVHCKIIFQLIGADNGAESVGLKWTDKIKY